MASHSRPGASGASSCSWRNPRYAGSCKSPDGKWLFVNQSAGTTAKLTANDVLRPGRVPDTFTTVPFTVTSAGPTTA